MPSQHSASSHPGLFIRKSVVPNGMTVKKASEMLGVGRPALSNLLNGKSDLSSNMALRLEKAFGANSEELLKLQAAYDQQLAQANEKSIAVRAYAASFIGITATQIDAWADKIGTRPLLPALLRRLVHSTCSEVLAADYPAYDNSQRHGWDGVVENDSAHPWVPVGRSGWEFGCDKNPATKAEHDYEARTKSVPKAERKRLSFVFVTPRNWNGKNEWAKKKCTENEWKDVKALDASDLEQWLELSVSTQAWIAEELGVPTEGITDLDSEWSNWATVSEPELSKGLFAKQCAQVGTSLRNWLDKPPERPFVIASDSIEEGSAFLVCALECEDVLAVQQYDRSLVFRSVQGFERAKKSSTNFLPVIASTDVELSSAGIHKTQHTVIIRTKNGIEDEPDFVLDLIDDETFKSSLIEMGIDEDEVEFLGRASGQSATVLRRHLSQVPEIRKPPWAQADQNARDLIPIIFAGVWDRSNDADQEVLATLSGQPYEKVEANLNRFLAFEQTPVWSIGRYRGVVSKIDSLFALHNLINNSDVESFLFTAEYVLSEDDPALDLPDSERWLADLHGKTRDHSSGLRESICETLVLLAVHGNNLLQRRLGIDVDACVAALTRRLLTPLSARTWSAQQHDLPRYAEAAPDSFLDIVESDLNSDQPHVLELLRPVDSGIFGYCSRTGLLWALEELAWKPARMPRVALILARLSETAIDDNWTNKPESSLEAIFRSWMPQTASDLDQRLAAFDKLVAQFPDVGWRICMSQLDFSSRVGSFSSKPRWRKDASGFGQPVTRGEDFKMRKRMLNIAIDWPLHDENTLGDLIGPLHNLMEDDQLRIWQKIEKWIESNPLDEQKAALREKIRTHTFTRRGRKKEGSKDFRGKAISIYNALGPTDVVNRHQWLFKQQWVEESFEELEDIDLDFKEREVRISAQREKALKEVWNLERYDGVLRLCKGGSAGFVIGHLLPKSIIPMDEHANALDRFVDEALNEEKLHNTRLLEGFLSAFDVEQRYALLNQAKKRWGMNVIDGNEKIVCACRAAPFDGSNWDFVDELAPELKVRYWREVSAHWGRFTSSEANKLIDELLAVDRPRAAMHANHLDWKPVSSKRLIKLLHAAATSPSEPTGHYQIDGHSVSEAFEVLSGRGDAAASELAQLEFFYLQVLDDSDYGIPNLERQLAESPAQFAELIGIVYKRNDGGTDSEKWHVNAGDVKALATQVYRIFQHAKRIPGTQENGEIDLKELLEWITETRALCKIYGRTEVGDLKIGELLSKCNADESGLWPCEVVRTALEEIGSVDITDGVALGVYNGRGAQWRGAGGQQERDLAEQYRGWAFEVSTSTPFVSRMLEQIAQHYERDAEWHDTDAEIRKRVR